FDLLGRAVELAEGHHIHEIDARNNLGIVCRHLGRLDEATGHHHSTLEAAQRSGYLRGELEALLGLAAVHLQHNEATEAFAHAIAALDRSRDSGHRLHQAQALTTLAATHLLSRNYESAIEQAAEAYSIQHQTGHQLGRAHTLLILGQARHRAGDTTTALGHWRDAEYLFATVGAADISHARALLTRHRSGTAPDGRPVGRPVQ
ncbi:MAG: tetratricopeptide repeat protein, partial [Pseudonocardiaceae bacterium]